MLYDDKSNDEQIAIRVQKGDADAFGVLVERYQDKIMRYGRRFLSNRNDIEDLVQDIFLRTYENMQSFDSGQKFSPWIYRIAHNVFVNGLRSKSRSKVIPVDLDTLIPHIAYEDPSESERNAGDIKKAIDMGMEQIPEKYREVLVLYYIEELSYKEIADVLEIPSGTVGIRLSRAREALKKELNRDVI